MRASSYRKNVSGQENMIVATFAPPMLSTSDPSAAANYRSWSATSPIRGPIAWRTDGHTESIAVGRGGGWALPLTTRAGQHYATR